MRITEFTEKDYKIHDREHLDEYLVELCNKVIKGQQEDSKLYGMVAAGVLDNDHNFVWGVNTAEKGSIRKHAERVAMESYEKKYGKIPEGSIVITTCSPCNEDESDMADKRYGESCTDLLNHSNVRKVYCGYMDPTQHDDHEEYTLEETANKDIQVLCKKFADTFLK
jgi:pyrimidine deaminase RibD-like protein